MNEEQRMAEVEKFKNYFSYISRPGADKLLAWLEETGFFTAPASTKYHGAYAGGLVEHTNYVYRRLVQLADAEDKRQGRTYPEYTVDTIAVAALLHDVCKVDAYKVEKKNQKQKDGSWKEVEVYGYTNSLPLGHGEKSIIQIMRYMQLTEEEMLAIRWHMGAFDSAVKKTGSESRGAGLMLASSQKRKTWALRGNEVAKQQDNREAGLVAGTAAAAGI